MNAVKMCCLLILTVFIAGCIPPRAETVYIPTIDSYENTISSISSEKSNLEVSNIELTDKIANLQNQLADITQTNIELEEKVNTYEAQITALEDEKKELKAQNTKIEKRVSSLHNLFLRTTGEPVGKYVFCSDAFATQFAYIDKLSMRKELVDYMARDSNINPNSITSEHHMIWSNTDDGLIKIFSGGYMYPYIVRFENEEFGAKNSVYSLTSGCYVDFPDLEKSLLSIIKD